MNDANQSAWSRAEFEARLRDKGKGYHIRHPVNVLLEHRRRLARADSRVGRQPFLAIRPRFR